MRGNDETDCDVSLSLFGRFTEGRSTDMLDNVESTEKKATDHGLLEKEYLPDKLSE